MERIKIVLHLTTEVCLILLNLYDAGQRETVCVFFQGHQKHLTDYKLRSVINSFVIQYLNMLINKFQE